MIGLIASDGGLWLDVWSCVRAKVEMNDYQNKHGQPAINISFPGSNPEGLSFEAMLHHLINGLAEVSVILMDADGMILRCTSITATRLGFSTPEDVVDKRLDEIAPEDWANERIRLIKKTIELNTQTTLLSILHGRRMRTAVNPIKLPDGSAVVLATIEQVSPECFDELRKIGDSETTLIGEVNDLGVLDVLSPRELEVLALLGQGHRPKDIATILHRSLSTVDGHRERIGEKLGVRDRAKLMSIARIAALQVDDAQRARIRLDAQDSPAD